MGNTTSTCVAAAALNNEQKDKRGSRIIVERLSPRGFSATTDSVESAVLALQVQVESMMKVTDTKIIQTTTGDYLIGVNNSYFMIDLLKYSSGNKYQAQVSIKI
jgi:hypothetical protein